MGIGECGVELVDDAGVDWVAPPLESIEFHIDGVGLGGKCRRRNMMIAADPIDQTERSYYDESSDD